MKKCPKCGTILDDSKKSCYMCGTSLDSSSKLDFGAAIDAAVGSTVTSEVDNVFNNGEDISVQSTDVVDPHENDAFFGKNNDAFAVFGESMDSLNNIKPSDPEEILMMENKKAEEARLHEEEAKRAELELQKQKEKEEAEKRKLEEAAERQRLREEKAEQRKAQRERDAEILQSSGGLFGIKKDDDSQVFIENVPVENIKPAINWGDNLRDDGRINNNRSLSFNKSFFFNTLCVFIFIGMLGFVYFKFLKADPNTKLELGSLKYTISDEFTLSSSDSGSRYYTYGDSCNLRITYGNTTDSDNYITNYFDNQKNTFLSNDKYKTVNESISINDNTWSVMKVVEYVENPSSSSGLTEFTKYRYVAIVYNNKFYTTVFVNINNDNTCSAMYNNFVNSLEF